jgi:predicted Holliday junction resolvase-like endonuclease
MVVFLQTTFEILIGKKIKEDTMRRKIIIILIVALFIAPNILWAQKDTKMMQGNMEMQSNMMMMSEMMMKMSKMLNKGDMKPEHQKQCGDMLKQMSQTIQNMSSHHGKTSDKQHEKELQKVEKELDPLYEYMISH